MKKFRILFLQISFAISIFFIITLIKFIFPNTFDDVLELYNFYFSTETDINLVIGGINWDLNY